MSIGICPGDQAGSQNAENELHARPAVVIRVGQQAGEVALENNTVKAIQKMVDERR